MATATGSSSSSHLMNDDVVMEILLRLPSVSVLRCRAVCKAWRAITSSPAFVAAHTRRRPPEIIVQRDIYAGSTLHTIPMATLDDAERRCLDAGFNPSAAGEMEYADESNNHKASKEIGYLARSGYRLIACCDGLLLLERKWEIVFPRYLVCNPVTRQWAVVTAPWSGTRLTMPCGFYLHKPSGQHRILFLTNDYAAIGLGASASHYVCSLEAAETRRLVGPSAATVDCFDASFIGYDLDDYRGRFILWLQHPEVKGTNKILEFDTVSETFRRMPLPSGLTGHDEISLLEMDGMVAVMANLNGTMDLWVMEDHDSDQSSWTRRLRVQLPPTLMGASWAMNAGVQGHILLGDYQSGSMGLYDLTQKRVLRKIPLTRVVTHGFRDSLQHHAFFLHLQHNNNNNKRNG